MPNVLAVGQPAAVEPNSGTEIEHRMVAGRLPWTGPLLLAALRPALFFTVQGLLALFCLALHRSAPWHEAGRWWTVYGTVVDIGCLLGLRFFTRREGTGLRDLIGKWNLRRGHDIFLGLGCFALVFPLIICGSLLAQVLLYGSLNSETATYLTQVRVLPVWALVYSVALWWIISSPTEELIYQGYALPRLQALTGRTWLAMIIVGFWWAAQHCLIPFVPDWKFLLFRFLQFVPGVLVLMLIYLRTRRLGPLIIGHWLMDILGAIMTTAH